MPHIDLDKAKSDAKTQLDVWVAACKSRGGQGHPTTHQQTHTLGKGYKGTAEDKPATILQTDWNQLTPWWSTLAVGATFNKWSANSFGGVQGVRDLCCACTTCPKISVRDFSTPSQRALKPPTFVYHLKVVQTAPPEILTIKASSNNKDDSLELDYKIVSNGVQSGKLNGAGRADVTLPPGVKADDCRFGFQGFAATSFNMGQASLLPGGRYMITITVV